MTTAITTKGYSQDQIELLKRTVCKGATDDEFALFLYAAKRTGLDPLTRQVHAVKRWDSTQRREVMAIQTGIDGYRLIADRTGKYAPGDVTVEIDKSGKIVSATAIVKKKIGDDWHEVKAVAYFDEYAAKKKDGSLTSMWEQKGRLMIMKCAEALALRRAFPAELSDVYAEEEMSGFNAGESAAPPIASPQSKKSSSNGSSEKSDVKDGETLFSDVLAQFKDVKQKKLAKSTKYVLTTVDDKTFDTFSKSLAQEAKKLGETATFKITGVTNRFGSTIKEYELVKDVENAEEGGGEEGELGF